MFWWLFVHPNFFFSLLFVNHVDEVVRGELVIDGICKKSKSFIRPQTRKKVQRKQNFLSKTSNYAMEREKRDESANRVQQWKMNVNQKMLSSQFYKW